jgi:hypothetical protein
MTAINQQQMEMFVKSPGCRRAVIISFMDGVVGEECADVAGADPCDRCTPRVPTTEVIKTPGEGRWRTHNEQEGRS